MRTRQIRQSVHTFKSLGDRARCPEGVSEWLLLILAVGALGVGVVAAFQADTFRERVGLVLTATGVTLAVAIYNRQKSQATASEKRIKGAFKDELDAVMKVAREEDSDATDEDEYPTAVQVLNEEGVALEGGFSYLPSEKVPLIVLSDLVSVWEKQGEKGRWEVGDLRWCLRRKGRGNHPWFVAFRDPATDQDRYWKVSRGGRSKSGPSATELDLSKSFATELKLTDSVKSHS